MTMKYKTIVVCVLKNHKTPKSTLIELALGLNPTCYDQLQKGQLFLRKNKSNIAKGAVKYLGLRL